MTTTSKRIQASDVTVGMTLIYQGEPAEVIFVGRTQSGHVWIDFGFGDSVRCVPTRTFKLA